MPSCGVPRVIERLRQRSLEVWITTALVAASVLFIFFQLQPGLLFLNTTPAGGDMGAHVWGPAFLREELLPRFRLSGWAPDWYDGFPAFQFYMVLPSLLIVVLDILLLFGATKLPALARSVGQSMKIFRNEIKSDDTPGDSSTGDAPKPSDKP